ISVLDVFYCPKNFETVANLILKCAIIHYGIFDLRIFQTKSRTASKTDSLGFYGTGSPFGTTCVS
ncbi:hypothetical protein, partial [Lacticaseibacillus casei]|uniref:hypothetical protein n=1 Tax=Lacticaseibacillus casei TaxID=1582 RepID=UPI001E36F330